MLVAPVVVEVLDTVVVEDVDGVEDVDELAGDDVDVEELGE